MQAWRLRMSLPTVRWRILLVSLSLASASSPLYLIRRTASIVSEWPWWKEFHSFWRELPNYNPIAVTTSTPGVDHAGQAATIFESTGHGDDDSDTGAIADEERNGDSANEAEEDGVEGKELDELSVVRAPNFCGSSWSDIIILILAVLLTPPSSFLSVKASPSEHDCQVVGHQAWWS